MRKPFAAYKGGEPYVFVCYAHADADAVYPEISWLHDQGFNIWYDEGIDPGTVWRAELAAAIADAALFLFFITPEAIKRPHCQREVSYAVDNDLPILAVYLRETELDPAMQLALGSIQGVLKYDSSEGDYRRKLIGSASAHLERGVASTSGTREIRGVPGYSVAAIAVLSLLLGAAGVGLFLERGNEPQGTEGVTTVMRGEVPVENQARAIDIFRISDDGRRIAFRNEELNPGRQGRAAYRRVLHVWDLGEFEATRFDGVDNTIYSLFFSEDGEWLGYFDDVEHKFKRVPVVGGDPVTTAALPQEVSTPGSALWLTDGSIVFASNFGLRTVTTDGSLGSLTQTDGKVWHRGPERVPGRRSILYEAYATGPQTSQVVALDLDSGESREVTEGARPQLAGPFLLFWREQSIWAARFDRDRLALASEAVPVLPLEGNWSWDASASGDLVYTRSDPLASMSVPVWVDQEGNESPLGLDPARFAEPRVSPDGQEVAFIINFEGKRTGGDIWVYLVNRQQLRRLTNDPTPKRAPVWSPDGQSIAFAGKLGDEWQILRIAANGLDAPQSILTKPYPVSPDHWTQDGKLIYTADRRSDRSVDTGSDIRAVALDSAEDVLVYGGTEIDIWSDLSPDGRWIAYTSTQSGGFEVYVRPYPDTASGLVQVSFGNGFAPTWSADGASIYYMSAYRGWVETEVETEPSLQIGTTRDLFRGSYLGTWRHRNYDNGPDGRFVVLKHVSKELPRLVFVRNWLTEVEKLVPEA